MGKVTRDGIDIYFDEKTRTAVWWKDYNQWEKETTLSMYRWCRKDKTSVDIGGWNGVHSIYMAHLSKRVIAVEADPLALGDYRLNVGVNPQVSDRITVVGAALSNTVGQAKLGAAIGWSGSSLMAYQDKASVEKWGEPVVVDCITFGQFLQQCDTAVSDIGFIKIDIEGAETFVVPSIMDCINVHGIVLNVSLHEAIVGADKIVTLKQLMSQKWTSIGTNLWRT